jgi:hypothetical protein
MRTLQTDILNQPQVSVLTHATVESGLLAPGAKIVIARYLYSRERGLGQSFMRFRACQLAKLASYTARGIGDYHAQRILQNDFLNLCCQSVPDSINRQSRAGAQGDFYEASPSRSRFFFGHTESLLMRNLLRASVMSFAADVTCCETDGQGKFVLNSRTIMVICYL